MDRICVVGAGHVGLVTAACLAELGNRVICTDSDTGKLHALSHGTIPFYEPGLDEMVARNADKGQLSFTSEIGQGVKSSSIVFISVGTPEGANGEADLSAVEAVSRDIAAALDGYKVIVEKSTVPVKTGTWVKRTIGLHNSQGFEFDVVSNPEFLAEGTAVRDFMCPDRVVLGVESQRAADIMTNLYRPLNAPIIVTDIESAELIKHASNSFLALKISYINAIANICERVGADVTKVAEGMGLDKRIGPAFLKAGAGYGGSCFPKDVAAFIRVAEESGYDFELLKAVQRVNSAQRQLMVKKVKKALWNLKGKTIGVLGIAFKPETDDIREAPAIDIIHQLQREGAMVKAYDPRAMEEARAVLDGAHLCANPYEVADGADALLIVTEWDEFKKLDLLRLKKLLRSPVIIDGRNIYDPAQVAELGFQYEGTGR